MISVTEVHAKHFSNLFYWFVLRGVCVSACNVSHVGGGSRRRKKTHVEWVHRAGKTCAAHVLVRNRRQETQPYFGVRLCVGCVVWCGVVCVVV